MQRLLGRAVNRIQNNTYYSLFIHQLANLLFYHSFRQTKFTSCFQAWLDFVFTVVGEHSERLELYIQHKRGGNNTGIPVFTIPLLFVLYYVTTALLFNSETIVYLSFKQIHDIHPLSLVLFGVFGIDYEKADELIDFIITYPRVSSPSQKDNTSRSDQSENLNEEADSLDAPIVAEIDKKWESANTMLRENVDKIVDIVQSRDGTCCLMLTKVDRLSRADPLEACTFLWIMRENDVILYFDELGYFDLSTKEQQMIVMLKLMQSREEYEKIIENGAAGQKSSKEGGEFPAKTPYGYHKKGDLDEFDDGNQELVIHEEEAEPLKNCVDLVINGDEEMDIEPGNIKAAVERIEELYGESNIPHYNSWLDILRRKKYTGELWHDGEQVGECPQIISYEKYQELIEIIGERSSKDEEEKELDHALLRVVEKFGVDASLEMFDSMIKGRCPQCGGDVKKWGSDRRWGGLVNSYRCENHPEFIDEDGDDSEDEPVEVCDFEGPLLTDQKLREWDSTIPLTCPACKSHLNNDWQRSKTKLNVIEQTCDNCGTYVAVDLPDDKYERAFQLPDESLRFLIGSDDDESNSTGGESASDDDNSGDIPEDNSRLDDFTSD